MISLCFLPVSHVGHIVYRDKCIRVGPDYEIHELLILMFINYGDDLHTLFACVGTCAFVESGPAVEIIYNEVLQLVHMFFRHDADAAFDLLAEDEMIQQKPAEVGAEDRKDQRPFVVDEYRQAAYGYARNAYGAAKIHVEILVHDLSYDIHAAGGSIVMKEDSHAYADKEDAGYHVYDIASRERLDIRPYPFKYCQVYRQKYTCVYRFDAEFAADQEETQYQQEYVYDHVDRRYRQRHIVAYYYGHGRDAADRSLTRDQEEIYRSRDDEHRERQYDDFYDASFPINTHGTEPPGTGNISNKIIILYLLEKRKQSLAGLRKF